MVWRTLFLILFVSNYCLGQTKCNGVLVRIKNVGEMPVDGFILTMGDYTVKFNAIQAADSTSYTCMPYLLKNYDYNIQTFHINNRYYNLTNTCHGWKNKVYKHGKYTLSFKVDYVVDSIRANEATCEVFPILVDK